MSKEVYEDLIEHGAPELPEGLFYAIRQWHDTNLFADNEVVRVSICERVSAGAWRGWWWRNLPGARYFMDNPYEHFLAGKTLPLIDKHPYQNDANVVHAAEDVPEAIAEACASLWAAIREAQEDAAALRKAVAIAKTWVGDHP